MNPLDITELRRFAWRARLASAAQLAPRGMTLARGQEPPGRARVLTDEALEREITHAEELRQEERNRRTSAMLQASEEARAGGDAVGAAEELRRLLLCDASHGQAWHLYALRLMDAHQYDAAFEALKNATEINPLNLEALELLLDAAHGRAERRSTSVEAINALTSHVPGAPQHHRRALDILIPTRRTAVIPALERSPDRVARAVVAQWKADLQHEDDEQPRSAGTVDRPGWLSQDEFLLAQLLYSLQRGRRSRAIALIKMLPPQAVSRWSLRQAIRRDLRANQLKGAQRLVREYLRLEPEDTWARSQAIRLTGSTDPNNYQLARQGFPFPPARRTPAVKPVPDRALYLLHNSLPYHSAGYSTRTHGLLSGLRGLGWDVQGVTRLGYPYDMPKMADSGEIPSMDVVDGVPYHRLSTTPGIEKKSPITGYVDRYVKALERQVRESRPFVLHGASNHWNGLAAVSAAHRLGLPAIYEVRGLWEVTRGSRDPQWAQGGMYRFMARMEADAAAHATRVLAITGALKEELVTRGVDEDKITVVPNAVDAERFTPQNRDAGLEAALGLRGCTVIGYIGSVLDYEGLGLLIDAADILRGRRNDFAMLIVGDGAELEKFQELVRERELEDFVRFTGRVPHAEVERYYSLVDIAPFPRLPLPVCEMVSPLKPFEALAMGKAVVASDVAALAEIIQPGVTGLLHRKGDAADLTRQLETLLDDDALRAELAEQGRNWVREHRQWTDVARIVSGIYEELGGRRATSTEEL